MRIVGKVILDKTPGRDVPPGKLKTTNDYYLALKITKINNQEINTTTDLFTFLKDFFPAIEVLGDDIRNIFSKTTLPPGAKDMPHITLGYFPDFRIDRDLAKDVDMDKVNKALDIENDEFSFDLSDNAFELVVANKDNNVQRLIQTNASIAMAPTVGRDRDAVLNLKPNGVLTQKHLLTLSQMVFGDKYEPLNSQLKPVPYHITVAQTNQLTQKLELAARLEASRLNPDNYECMEKKFSF